MACGTAGSPDLFGRRRVALLHFAYRPLAEFYGGLHRHYPLLKQQVAPEGGCLQLPGLPALIAQSFVGFEQQLVALKLTAVKLRPLQQQRLGFLRLGQPEAVQLEMQLIAQDGWFCRLPDPFLQNGDTFFCNSVYFLSGLSDCSIRSCRI